jgi:hypothetical protein
VVQDEARGVPDGARAASLLSALRPRADGHDVAVQFLSQPRYLTPWFSLGDPHIHPGADGLCDRRRLRNGGLGRSPLGLIDGAQPVGRHGTRQEARASQIDLAPRTVVDHMDQDQLALRHVKEAGQLPEQLRRASFSHPE